MGQNLHLYSDLGQIGSLYTYSACKRKQREPTSLADAHFHRPARAKGRSYDHFSHSQVIPGGARGVLIYRLSQAMLAEASPRFLGS